MQDRSSTMARQNQQSAYAKAPGGGNTNTKKSTGYTNSTSQTKPANDKNAGNGSWGPHFKNRDHFVSMHFS